MDERTYRGLERMLQPLMRKVRLAISTAVLEAVKDTTGIQTAQVDLLDSETTDPNVEHYQPGGLTHVPRVGAEGVFLSVGGDREHGVVLALANRALRFKGLEPGETALWSCGDVQCTVHLKADGTITISNGEGSFEMAPSGDVTINGVVITAAGELTAPGEITAMAQTPATAVKVSTHLHATAVGPSQSPTPGT